MAIMDQNATSNPHRKMKKLVIILAVLVALLIAALVYFYLHGRALTKTNSAAQSEAKALAAKVVKAPFLLPTDETPTIATVSDPNALKDQVFFSKAKVGDKVLIYTNAKIAVLYDPNLNQIITVAPLNIGDQKAGVTPPPTSTKSGTSKTDF